MPTDADVGAEWLETDGLGGFASGPVVGPRTRRYHALLVTARNPPGNRVVLINGAEAWVETPAGRWCLTPTRYVPDVLGPYLDPTAFTTDPWPTWTYRLPDGTEVIHELCMSRGLPVVTLSWRLASPRPNVTLTVRPFLTGRDLHALHHENPAFRFDATVTGGRVQWRPYDTLPAVVSLSNGTYTHNPQWYRQVQYDLDRARGYDYSEDVAAPGTFRWNLSAGEAAWLLGPDLADAPVRLAEGASAVRLLGRLRTGERRRRFTLVGPLRRVADDYLVRRGAGATIIAGYPWFGDWGRDTCIAVRGLCLATGQFAEAGQILLEWAGHVADGMLPNRFPEHGEAPEYNAVDASLWFVIAAYELLRAGNTHRWRAPTGARLTLRSVINTILSTYTAGTRYRIHADADGLLAAGEPGVQLTWMDARVDGQVITPRIGKPVEVQALWINALRLAADDDVRWRQPAALATLAFRNRFWRSDVGYCYDVVDVDHEPGRVDTAFRPNQLFAVGGLPLAILDLVDGRRLVDAVEQHLWTPMGPRTLAPDDPAYQRRYAGAQDARDRAYHQGTVWPWLTGAFVDAWVRVRGDTPDVRAEARRRFVEPLLATVADGPGVGHIPELANGDPPHTPGGSPFQAWSVAELLRLEVTL
jgi:predicted glycogen debranching enzyme